MRKYIFTLCFWMGCMAVSWAQQLPQYSLFPFNKYAVNPAYAGMDESLSITAQHRSQWVDLPGAPVTQQFNVHAPLYFLGGAAGLKVELDEIGAHRYTRVQGSFSQILRLGTNSSLALALSGGYLQRRLDGNVLRAPDGNYEDGNLSHNDDLLSEALQSTDAIAVGAGLLLTISDFQIGLAAENLNEPLYDFDFSEGGDLLNKRHFFLHTSYNLYAGERVQLQPNVLVRSDMIQTQVDFMLKASYDNNVFFGGGMRGFDANSLDAIAIFGGIKLGQPFTLAYNYDVPLSDLQDAHSGTHEIMLNYNLGRPIGKGRLPKVIYNPRFL